MLSKPFILNMNEVCTMSYLVISNSNNEKHELIVRAYMMTKFARVLILPTIVGGISLTSKNFIFVPIQDFSDNSDIDWSKSIDDIDKQLYKKYSLTEDEIVYIESTIKPMSI